MTHPLQLSHFYQQAASFLLFFSEFKLDKLLSFFPSFPYFDLEFYWVPNPLRKHLLTWLIALSEQFNTTLSAGFITSGSSSSSFCLYSFPHLTALLVVCVIFLGLRRSFLVFILFPLLVFMLTRWSKTRQIAHVAIMLLFPLTAEAR